jgi:hypothetical protein
VREPARARLPEPLVWPLPSDHEELVEYLESDQLEAKRARPLGRAHLSSRAAAGLWALGAFTIVMAVMVIYTFVAQL